MKTMNKSVEQIKIINSKKIFHFTDIEGVDLWMTSADSLSADISDDEKSNELQNLYQHFHIEKSKVYSGYQVHSDNIAIVDSEITSENAFYGYEYTCTDGLITEQPGVWLITKFADCTPVVLYDPKKKILANLHSGWRGTQQKIVPKAIETMIHRYDSDPKEILVFVGPAISKDNFEVQDDLIKEFNQSHGDISAYLTKKENGRYLFDMRSLLLNNLLSCGIAQSNIFSSDLDTYSNPMLHSYRRDGKKSGRMLLFAAMK